MKFILGILILGGGIAALFYYSGAFTHDPAAQAKEAFAKIEKCTTMTQVLAVAKPRKYCVYVKKTTTLPDGSTLESWVPGAEMNFDEAVIKKRLDDGMMEGGYTFIYRFSDVDRFDVKFDSFGNVESVEMDDRVRKLFDM